jgi:hypothetical protein
MNKLSDIGFKDLMPLLVYYEIVRLWDNYAKKYDVSENNDTRTTATISSRKKAHATYETELRRIIRYYIENNLRVTDEQLTRRVLATGLISVSAYPGTAIRSGMCSDPDF